VAAVLVVLGGVGWAASTSTAPPGTPDAVAGVEEDIVQDELSGEQAQEIARYLERINQDLGGRLPPTTIRDWWEVFRGRKQFDWGALGQALLSYFLGAMLVNLRLLGQLVVLAVIAAVLANLQAAYEGETVARTAWTVAYLLILVLGLAGFHSAVSLARGAITDLVGYMLSLLPVLAGLCVAAGAVTTAGILSPAMIVAVHAISVLVADVVLPLVVFSVVLDVASNLGEAARVTQLAELFRSVATSTLGILLAVFLGITAVSGAAGAVVDGVAVRTAKFLSSSFIPVVGKMFSDAVEVVVGTSLLVKSVVGVTGLLVLVLTVALPLLKLAALVLVYRLAAALVQPLGAGMVADTLASMGHGLTLITLATAAVALMFFLAASIMLGAGWISMAFR